MKLPFWPNFIGNRDIKLGLNRVYKALERVGNPHLKIPPTIHFAGTNGKGSTLSFVKNIFIQSNLKVHSYTSPHLVNFNERIFLANEEISDDFLNECLLTCKNASEIEPKIELTFFEATTIAAFLAFSKVKADILLLETGMGGRLDATNILPKVLASVITPISMDHVEFLGKTLPKIAFEKAGIIKKNCPTFIAKQKPSALKIIKETALKQNSKTLIFNENFKISKKSKSFIFNGFGQEIEFQNPLLLGKHQIENASLAIATALFLKEFEIKTEAIKKALAQTKWRARLEKIEQGKFFEKLATNQKLFLDGSHNLQGANTILQFLKSQNKQKRIVIFSMLSDKNYTKFLTKIASEIDLLLITKIKNEPKSIDPKIIKNLAQNLKIKSKIVSDFNEAFLQTKTEGKALILITGSLYQAGSFLEEN